MRALSLAFAAMAAAFLSGCGGSGGEDFAVEIARSPSTVLAPLAAGDISEARAIFPSAKVQRTRPSDLEVLYTVPGTDGKDATLRFRLEPVKDGKATVVHASIDVPARQAKIDGVVKVLSERKVETEVRRMVNSTKRSLEMGSAAGAESRELSAVLFALAISGSQKLLDQAMELKNNPAKLAQLEQAMAWAGDFGSGWGANWDDAGGAMADPDADAARDSYWQERAEQRREGAQYQAGIAQDDPDAALDRAESARESAEWSRESKLERSSQPMDDADGDYPGGGY